MRKMLIISLTVLTILVLSPVVGAELEEDPDAVLFTDRVIEGNLQVESDESVMIGEEEFDLCTEWHLYDPRGRYVDRDLIKNAEMVRAFFDGSRGCIRKIKVLKFAD